MTAIREDPIANAHHLFRTRRLSPLL